MINPAQKKNAQYLLSLGSASQNHNETVFHTYQCGYYKNQSNKSHKINIGWDIETLKSFVISDGNVKCYSCYKNSMAAMGLNENGPHRITCLNSWSSVELFEKD